MSNTAQRPRAETLHNNSWELVSGVQCIRRISELVGGQYWALVTSNRGQQQWLEQLASTRQELAASEVLLPGATPKRLNGAIMRTLVAFGGGSTIDRAKAFVWDQITSDGQSCAARIIAVPTLSGSGAEATPFASIWSHGRKASIEDRALQPSHTLLVPEWSAGTDPDHALPPALDALAHAMESIWNRNFSDASDRYASEAIHALVSLIPILASRPLNVAEQADLMRASFSAGSAIALTRTALAHSMSYPFTGELGLLHGVATSFALPEIARFNLEAAPDRLVSAAAALACAVGELPDVLRQLVRNPVVTCRFAYPPPGIIEHLQTPLTASVRALNNIRPVTEQDAREMAARALVEIANA